MDKKQQLTWKQNQERILKAIRKIETRDLTRPYANILEIHRETGISRPTIYKHIKALQSKQLVFPVQAKGKGTWVQSRYAKVARKIYEETLQKDLDLQQFIENPPRREITPEEKDGFREKLTLALVPEKSELTRKIHSDVADLKNILEGYFSKGKGKLNLFLKNPIPLWFARRYTPVAADFEDTLQEWQIILYNKEYYEKGFDFEKLKESATLLSKVICDLNSLVHTANFLAINYQYIDDVVRFQFRDSAERTLDSCAIALRKINEVLSHA
ncbi:HTH domain-containing protein [Candidatus Bathyarchaeota archaeon A05DMB-2]|jgi:DNA-binding transcriptional regulator GbsR (MarR family)|nr:HTH domain-containing protein [Candidatus Bathyarchaeota archaeon A05DMB-2]